MAKFKVGDKVKQTDGPGKGATGQIVNIYPLRPDMVASMGFGEYVGHDMVTFMGPQGKSIVPEDWLVANAKACNGVFKKGDRVVFVKSGDGGTVQEVYGDEWYAVQRDGANDPDNVQGFQIRAANSAPLASNRASVFEYGVGDTVKLQSGRKGEVIAKYADKNGDIKVDVSIRGTRFTVLPNEIESVIKNSAPVRSTNAVVQNAINARRARNAIDFNGASAKVRKALEGRLEKLVQKFKNDIRAVSTDVANEYKKYKGIEPDSATLILEVNDWIESLKGSIDSVW